MGVDLIVGITGYLQDHLLTNPLHAWRHGPLPGADSPRPGLHADAARRLGPHYDDRAGSLKSAANYFHAGEAKLEQLQAHTWGHGRARDD